MGTTPPLPVTPGPARAKVDAMVRLPSLAAAAVLLAACATAAPRRAHVHFPPQAMRLAPPPGIHGRALKVGARAPGFTLPEAGGGTWSLAGHLARGPVVLVFYRGFW